MFSQDDFFDEIADQATQTSPRRGLQGVRRTLVDELDCTPNSWDVFNLSTCLDEASNELVFLADIPNNSWLSIGFGTSMSNTDMIAWFAKDGRGAIRDLWSTGYGRPGTDTSDNLISTSDPVYDSNSDRVSFVTRRALDTQDSQDFAV